MSRPKKSIKLWTDAELDDAIKEAVERVPMFWLIMRGVDAYMERRLRREDTARAEMFRKFDEEFTEENCWGDN